MVSKEYIAELIAEYIQVYGNSVLERKWNGKYIYRHAPYNRSNNCYYEWLKWVNENAKNLQEFPTFEKILEAINAKDMFGIGPLTRYDTATQLAFPDKKYPKKVYLHAGTTNGANAIGVFGETATKDQFVEICSAFKKLNTAQIEDFLCVFSPCLMENENACKKLHEKISKKIKSGKKAPHC